MKILERYKQNLRIDGNRVISYTTHVATIENGNLIQLGWWSNYFCERKKKEKKLTKN